MLIVHLIVSCLPAMSTSCDYKQSNMQCGKRGEIVSKFEIIHYNSSIQAVAHRTGFLLPIGECFITTIHLSCPSLSALLVQTLHTEHAFLLLFSAHNNRGQALLFPYKKPLRIQLSHHIYSLIHPFYI